MLYHKVSPCYTVLYLLRMEEFTVNSTFSALDTAPIEGRMPICIECCYPVSQLYHVLHSRKPKSNAAATSNLANVQKANTNIPKPSETKTRSKHTGAGEDVRLTQCPRCKRFADKYVEHDFVVLFIDLVLVKPQVSSTPKRLSRNSQLTMRFAY